MFLDRIHPVCEAFEAAWRAGSPPDIAAYLDGWDGEERAKLFEFLLELDLDYRSQTGAATTLNSYVDSFPEYAEIVARYDRDHSDTVRADDAGDSTTVPNHSSAEPSRMPTRIGDYEILNEIARGGMGVVVPPKKST